MVSILKDSPVIVKVCNLALILGSWKQGLFVPHLSRVNLGLIFSLLFLAFRLWPCSVALIRAARMLRSSWPRDGSAKLSRQKHSILIGLSGARNSSRILVPRICSRRKWLILVVAQRTHPRRGLRVLLPQVSFVRRHLPSVNGA